MFKRNFTGKFILPFNTSARLVSPQLINHFSQLAIGLGFILGSAPSIMAVAPFSRFVDPHQSINSQFC